MKTIWKFELETTDQQTIKMPNGSEILTVQVQHGIPCLWTMVDPDEQWMKDRIIEINGTGHSINGCTIRKYIGTYQLRGGSFIGHVFEKLNN